MTAAAPAPRRPWLLALAWLAALCLACGAGAARADQPVPELQARVTDLTGTLDAGQRQALSAKLADLEARKGAQLAVLVVGTTEPETVEQYAVRVFEAWKLGRKAVDDGILLLVAKDDRALRIEVGYGLEGAVTDVLSGRIIRERIAPRFAQGDFYGGLDAGVDSLIGLVDGEPLPAPPPAPASQGGDSGGSPLELLFAALVFVLAAPAWVAGLAALVMSYAFSGSLVYGLVGGAAGFGLSALLGLAGFKRRGLGAMARRGGYGGGIGGGWRGGGGFGGGGGGFGGGFGGGGGNSGGGGASGRW